MKEQSEHDKLVQHIKYIVELAGFKLTDRVKLMHKQRYNERRNVKSCTVG